MSTDPIVSHEIKVLHKKSEWTVGDVSHFRESGRTLFHSRKMFLHRLGAAMAAGNATATPQTLIHVRTGIFLRHVLEKVWAGGTSGTIDFNMAFNYPSKRLGNRVHYLTDCCDAAGIYSSNIHQKNSFRFLYMGCISVLYKPKKIGSKR